VTEPATADDLDAAAQSLLAALAATALTRDTDPDFEESTARLADRLEALASRLPAMLEVIAAAAGGPDPRPTSGGTASRRGSGS
jgi:hypothetical protein